MDPNSPLDRNKQLQIPQDPQAFKNNPLLNVTSIKTQGDLRLNKIVIF